MGTFSRPLSGGGASLWEYLTSGGDDSELPTRESDFGIEYYFGLGSGFGDAVGKGAEKLGVRQLTRAQFVNLAEGVNLGGTEQVIQHNNGKHVAGIDVTFTAYKSVSTLLTIVSDKERTAIQAAWDDCVLAAFERMEATAKLARRTSKKPSETGEQGAKTQGSTTERVPAHLIGFVARHHTARPTAETESRGAPPDPHLHTHIFVFNLAWVPDESHPDSGKLRAIDDYGIKGQAEQREHELQGEFARRLEAMGYRLRYSTDRRGRVSWEIEGITDEATSFFSSNARRAAELKVDFEVKNFRPPSEAEVRNLMRSSRLKKDHASEAEPNWAAIGEAASLAGVEIGTVLRHSPVDHGPQHQRLAELQNRLEAPTGLCRDDAVFDRNTVRASVARCAVGLGLTLRELDQFSADFIEGHLVLVRPAENPEHAYWTTKANLNSEQTIAATLDSKASEVFPAPSPAAIERAVADLSQKQGIELDQEQRALVSAVCSTEGLVNVEGWAGTGKTTALKAVVSAFRDRQSTGRATADQIVAISTASDTAQRTGRKLETDAWHSIEAFCSAVGKGRLRPTQRTVILIDEAVMVDTPRMAELLAAAGPARIVCIGDPAQLQAIGAGGWYADQVARHGKTCLTKVHRQKDQADVEAFAALRSGDAAGAIANLAARDRVHIAESREDRMGRVIADYVARRDAGRSVDDVRIVLDGANTEIDTANRILQQDRLRRGEITGPALALHSTMTRRTWSLHEGDEGSFLAPWSDPCAGLYVANGTRARVEKIDHEKRTVKLRLVDDGQTVMVPMPEKADEQLFGLTYAVHAQRLQGGEAPIILAAPGKYTTSLEAGYSQLTRCVEEVHVYVDRETHGADPTLGLTKAWRASKPKVSASARLREAGHTPDPGFLPVEELALSDTPPLGRLAGPGDGPDVLRLQHADRSFGLGLELAIPC